LGFKNLNSGKSFTVNFDASPSFIGAIIPTFVKNNGTTELVWENFGAVFIYLDINATYWDAVNHPIASMTGMQLKQFLSGFINRSNKTYTHYNIWSVYNDWPGPVLVPNFECFAYVWECFKELSRLGASFYPDQNPRQSFLTLYSHEMPKIVDTSIPEDYAEVVTFYETLEAKLDAVGPVQFLLELWDILVDGIFYVRKDSYYYKVNLCCPPYFGVHFTEVPLPLVPTTTIPTTTSTVTTTGTTLKPTTSKTSPTTSKTTPTSPITSPTTPITTKSSQPTSPTSPITTQTSPTSPVTTKTSKPRTTTKPRFTNTTITTKTAPTGTSNTPTKAKHSSASYIKFSAFLLGLLLLLL